MYELLLLIPAFFLFLFVCRLYCKKSFDHITFICLIWLIVSICGYIYTTTSILYIGKGNVTIGSVIFLILMYYITMKPIENSRALTKANYTINGSKILVWAMYIIAICSYLPFLENMFHLLSGNTITSVADNYDAREEVTTFDARSHMTWLGARFNSVTLLVKYITPILLMNYIAQTKKKYWVVIGLIMGIFNPSIFMFNMGSRWVAIEDILFLIFLFLLYKNCLSLKTRYFVQIAFSVVLSVIVMGLIYITIGRFGDSNYNISEWLYRYIGEGFANFSTDMWYADHTANGMQVFRVFYDDAISRLNTLMGIRMYVFYTYVGDIFADWGIYGCIIVCIIIGILGKLIFAKKKYDICSVFAMSMYCKILLTGFTYIIYINTLTELTIGSIFFYLVKVSTKK